MEGQKARSETHVHNSVKLNRFTKLFTGGFLGKSAVNWQFKIPPLLAHVATLPCETSTSENKRLTINYKVV